MRIIGNRGNTARKVQAIASGALASGDTVVVNADGTVSVISETSATEATGTAVTFEGAQSYYISSAYDSTNSRVVISYRDQGDSNRGKVAVGVVSGSSITFGTPVQFSSGIIVETAVTFDSSNGKVVVFYSDYNGSSYTGKALVGTVSGTTISFGSSSNFSSSRAIDPSAIYDPQNEKVIVAYKDAGNSNYGTAIVGTVSGTSISFGSAVVFESAEVTSCSVAYDDNAQKVVIAYRDSGNSNYGTAVVGTVSGTSISFGSAVVFESAYSLDIAATYDSNAQKIVIAYRDLGNSSYGTAIVGTVSGTSISFGTPSVFESAGVSYISASFDPLANKVIIAYQDGDNSSYGTFCVGTVSGTTISFTTPAVFESADTSYTSAVFDVLAGRTVISYSRNSSPDSGRAFTFQNAYTITNLTSENFIGIASNGYASGQAATINAKGFIDDNQSSLTAGQSYFVQSNGDLGLTAGTPSVFAGTAVSATKLIVKG